MRLLDHLRPTFGRLPPAGDPKQFAPDLDCPPGAALTRLILIASTPRSGSHLLGHMLRDHGGFGVPLEYLNNLNYLHWSKRFGIKDRHEVLARCMALRTSPNGTFTLKAHWHQFAAYAADVDRLTQGHGIDQIIWIQRRDLLAQAISLVIARQTQAWISGAPIRRPASYSFDLIAQAAQQIVGENQAWQAYLRQHYPHKTLTVTYEDLCDPASAAHQVYQTRLGLDHPLTPASCTQRQATDINAHWHDRFRLEAGAADQWILNQWDWSL